MSKDTQRYVTDNRTERKVTRSGYQNLWIYMMKEIITSVMIEKIEA